MLRRKHLSIAKEIVLDYVPPVLVAVKESVKDAKAVVRMGVKRHAVKDVVKAAKENVRGHVLPSVY